MDNRIGKMRVRMEEAGFNRTYFFSFENLDGKEIARVTWYWEGNTGKQFLGFELSDTEIEQFKDVIKVYFSAKPYAENYDIEGIEHLFIQWALCEDIEVVYM